MRDGGRAERPLSIAADAPDGAVGEAGLHSHSAEAAGHAASTVSIRDQQVSCTHLLLSLCQCIVD